MKYPHLETKRSKDDVNAHLHDVSAQTAMVMMVRLFS